MLKKYLLAFSLSWLGFLSSWGTDVSLEDKIGQLFILGFKGAEVDEDSPIMKDIQERNLGGVILFDIKDGEGEVDHGNIESPEQVRKLVKTLKEAAQRPLLIAVDQEGGKVNRLKTKYGFPEANITAKELGEMGSTQVTYEYGRGIAKTLGAMGIMVNFAPVVDLREEGNFIDRSGRAYSIDAIEVRDHAEAFIDGHREEGVLTSLKHFPGHGSSKGDTHEGFVDVTKSWSYKELEPYKDLIEAGKVDMIMVAHVFNERLDDEYPASISERTIQGLLRERLGYEGVVVTDDLSMGAILKHYSLKEAVVRAFGAGNDLVIIGHEQVRNPDILEELIVAVKDGIEAGRIRGSHIEEAYDRVTQLKGASQDNWR